MVQRSEAIAEIIPERYAQFGAGVHQAEESIAAISSCVAVRAAADLALDDVTADVALGTIGVQRDLRPVEHGQQLGLVGIEPLQQAIEGDEAGAATEDAIEASAHLTASPCGGCRAVGLQIGVEPPNERADALLRGVV